jgi:hypothetical protein
MPKHEVPFPEQLLNDQQVCAIVGGITPRTLRLWRNTRGFPHLKLSGKVIRYRRTYIDRWLDDSRTIIGGNPK